MTMRVRDRYRDPFSKYEPPPNLPNATISMILGNASMVLAFFLGLPGLICGIIGLRLIDKDEELYQFTPSRYSPGSICQSKGARICCYIGIVIGVTLTMTIIFIVLFYGTLDYKILRHHLK
ncbi:MAG: hypothetical protein IPJ81_04935 [Chitinophagaceae bacterium]|nr:hypothetical protein [Chitinophagaceae bacterium]